MAYRFNASTDRVEFAAAPLIPYTAGAFTAAFLIKPATGSIQQYVGVVPPGGGFRFTTGKNSGHYPTAELSIFSSAGASGNAMSDAAKWYIAAVTYDGGNTQPRMHVHDGATWTHVLGGAAFNAAWTGIIQTGDVIRVGQLIAGSYSANADICCAGIDRANHTDAEIETLSRTLYQAWKDFGFDWLTEFGASGTRTDDGAAGTGDEVSRVGTTLVADPPGWSAAPPDATAPTTPTGLGATPTSATQIDLAWTASTDAVGVTGYKVERKTGAGAFAEVGTPTGTSYSDTGLTASTAYTYRVRATDAAGNLSGYSAEASATTPAPPDTTAPSAPAGLTATADYATAIDLAWTAATDAVGVTGYKVERKAGAGAFVEIATPTATAYRDTDVDPSTAYTYRVRATDAAANLSTYSGEASATTTWYPDPAVTDWVPLYAPPS